MLEVMKRMFCFVSPNGRNNFSLEALIFQKEKKRAEANMNTNDRNVILETY